MSDLIKLPKSIIPSCDVSTLEKYDELIQHTCGIKGVGAYKIGFTLTLPYTLRTLTENARRYTDLPLIYDHQKAGTDIPDTGEAFAKACRAGGVDAVIYFPLAGPETEKTWIKTARDAGLTVIIGGHMTHQSFLQSEGGFIADEAPKKIFQIAVENEVTDFVLPGNKPDKIKEYREYIVSLGCQNPVFYSPGLVTQGGDLTESAKAAGDKWHAIIGRAIYEAYDVKHAAKELASKLLK